jgi:hypothetical protein
MQRDIISYKTENNKFHCLIQNSDDMLNRRFTMIAFMGIPAESIIFISCMLCSSLLIVALGKVLQEQRFCNQGWSTVIACWIWLLVFAGLLTLLPHQNSSCNPRLFYPYTTMIICLLPFTAGGIGLTIITVIGICKRISKLRKNI